MVGPLPLTNQRPIKSNGCIEVQKLLIPVFYSETINFTIRAKENKKLAAQKFVQDVPLPHSVFAPERLIELRNNQPIDQ